MNFGLFFHGFRRTHALSFEMLAAHQRTGEGSALRIFFVCVSYKLYKGMSIKSFVVNLCVRNLASNRIPRLHRLYSVDESESIMLLPFDGNRFWAQNVHQRLAGLVSGRRTHYF